MTLLRLIEQFMDTGPTFSEIKRLVVEPDAERIAQIAQKVEAAKSAMGTRYVLHPANRIGRKEA